MLQRAKISYRLVCHTLKCYALEDHYDNTEHTTTTIVWEYTSVCIGVQLYFDSLSLG